MAAGASGQAAAIEETASSLEERHSPCEINYAMVKELNALVK